MKEKVVVGMSGGVDSSVTLYLLKQMGYEPIGVTLRLAKWDSPKNKIKENVCCTEETICRAKEICEKLGVEHHTLDTEEDFEKIVMGYFVDDLKNNRTPNPCIICNRKFKFKQLLDFADKHNIRYISTGHYAVIEKNETGKFELKVPKDKLKDQTYGLCLFNQEMLSRLILPLGKLTKDEVYKTAKEAGFSFYEKIKQSQDLCFVSGNALPLFIEEKLGKNEGDIVDTEGNIIGKHKGLYFYTIGQKRRLYLPGTYFVKGFDVKDNVLLVTKNREDIFSKKDIVLNPYNIISGEKIEQPIKIIAKIRYGDSMASEAVIQETADNKLSVHFKEPRHAVTPGQFCVFYKDDICLGGGIIN